MSLDLEALKEAALAATPGPWLVGQKVGVGVYAGESGAGAPPICVCDSMGELPPGQDWANDAYIAAANPAAVLMLIERLEKAEAIVGKVTALAEKHFGKGAMLAPGIFDSMSREMLRAVGKEKP